MIGFFIALLSGALMSVQGVFNTEVTKVSSIWTSAAWVQLSALITCLIAWGLSDRKNPLTILQVTPKYMLLGGVILGLLSRVWTQKVTLDAQTVMGILLIGVVGTAMAFTLYLQGVNDIGPVKTSLLSCAELVTAGVLTSVWLKTPLAWQDVLGMALILGMVAFLAVPGRTTPNTTRSNS